MNLPEYIGYVHDEITKHLGLHIPEGIYAGSAISSIVLSKLWNRQIEIVDLFERYLDYPDQIEDSSCHVVRYTRPFDAEPSLESNGYAIMSSWKNGNLITRRCLRKEMVLGENERALNVIRGLGLNALQVAYYWDGKGQGSIYATEAFAEFAHTRQLRITCPVLGKSFLELAKFQDLYGAYVDWDEEVLLMSGFRQTFEKCDHACDDELLIGDKLLMEKFKNRPGNYFRIDELEQMVLPGCEDDLNARWRIEFKQIDKADIQTQIHRARNCSPYSLTSYTFTFIFNILFRKSTRMNHKQRFWRALEEPVAAKYVMDDTRFLRSDFTIKHLQELSKFETCHPRAMKVIAEVNHDFLSIVRVIRLVKKLGRFHGNSDFIIGLLELAPRYGIQLEEITEQSMNELIATYSSIGDSILIDAADLSHFKHKDSMTELTSSDALRWEGVRCSNCIGGYAGLVRKSAGNVRIFHVHTKDDNQHGTAAIYFNRTGNNIVEYELFGPKNTESTKKHKKITNSLAGYLRDTIWKSEIKVEEQTIDFDTEQ